MCYAPPSAAASFSRSSLAAAGAATGVTSNRRNGWSDDVPPSDTRLLEHVSVCSEHNRAAVNEPAVVAAATATAKTGSAIRQERDAHPNGKMENGWVQTHAPHTNKRTPHTVDGCWRKR